MYLNVPDPAIYGLFFVKHLLIKGGTPKQSKTFPTFQGKFNRVWDWLRLSKNKKRVSLVLSVCKG